MQALRYLAIEGPIGVGKTSLARLLGQELRARLVLEQVEENPFLSLFYRDPRRYAFQAQLFFLLARYRQLQALSQPDLFEQVVIADYIFPKDRIFASLNLATDELALYDQVYRLLNLDLPQPDLVLYLQADPEVLSERVKTRGQPYEKEMTWEYLVQVHQAYRDFFFCQYTATPLLIIQTGAIDFVHNRTDLEDLLHQIQQMKGGIQYYTPRP